MNTTCGIERILLSELDEMAVGRLALDVDEGARSDHRRLRLLFAGMRYRGGDPVGPQLNRLTSSEHCDPLARTPYHKHVPVRVRALS